jgi:hypothetical protein
MFIFARLLCVMLRLCGTKKREGGNRYDTQVQQQRKGSPANCGCSGVTTQAVVIVRNCGENEALQGESQA